MSTLKRRKGKGALPGFGVEREGGLESLSVMCILIIIHPGTVIDLRNIAELDAV